MHIILVQHSAVPCCYVICHRGPESGSGPNLAPMLAPPLSWPPATSPPTTSTVIYIKPGPGITQCTPLPIPTNDGREMDSQNVWAAAESLKQVFKIILRAAWNETRNGLTHFYSACDTKVLISEHNMHSLQSCKCGCVSAGLIVPSDGSELVLLCC